ncbi:hypothetical protein BGW41_005701 [Actinomortierella wolfii]|nr:hypothetical protein BGW41_005701 [Actinomortierella wolfii]
MLLSVSEGASTGQTAPVVAPNVSVSGLSVQPSLNQYLAELGLPLSSLLPTDLARHGTPPLSQHEGKRSAYPTQPSVHQPSLPTGLQLPSTIKAQQPPLRRGSKSGKPSTPRSSIPGSSYDPLSMDGLPVHSTPWPNTAIAATIPPILPLPSLSNTDLPPSGTAASGTHAQEQQRSSAPLNSNPSVPYPQRQQHYKPYHGPAPCGNPDPLYEYLASPTIVPGLEIIGHDYYGNYVQVLPICPDTSCSMNQDPIYLNLLQAIYAHTIPFLDLPPCSEEESKALLDGLSPSAIHPQSVQPPFLHLLPPKLPPRGGANDPTRGWSGYYQTTLGGQTALFNDQNGAGSMKQSTSLNSLKAIVGQTPLSAGQSLNRRASLAAFPPSSQINNNSALPPTNGRRSSTGSFPSVSSNNPNIMNQSNPITNPNNPARKKKNMPRTHPYKSTSAHRDENPMVMDTIMALSSSKSCGASVTGGLASFLGESHDVPDPKRKVVEKMVHMDETEYANHYMKHHRSMRKSASTTAVSLIQTMATAPKSQTLGSWACQTGSQKQAATQGLKRLQQGQGKQSDTNAGVTTVPQNAGLDGMDASDFIRAMTRSQCLLPHTNTQEPLTTTPSNDETGLPPTIASAEELAELEKIVMSMDSASVAAVQAAASAMSWPKWVDFKQLEHDFCGYQANSNNHTVDVSSSFAIAGVDNSGSASQEAPKLLLSSGTDLDTMDDPMVAEDTMAMTSLSLSDKPSSSPNLSPSSAPNDVQQQQTCSDMDCDQKPPISHLQSTSASGVHDMSPLPKQVCDTKPPPNPSGPLRVPSPPPPNHHQQQQQQQHQQTQEQPLDPMAGLAQPYTSSILTVLPFAPEHSRPIFPTRGARRTGWYRSKAVASRGLSAITGVDYTTTCWYNVEQLEQIIKESIAASPITETNPLDSRTFEALIDRPSDLAADKSAAA